MTEDKQITIFDGTTGSHHQDYKLSVDELRKELSRFNLTANPIYDLHFLGKVWFKNCT